MVVTVNSPTRFLILTWEYVIFITSRLVVELKGLGGLNEVLQLISNQGYIEQPEPKPMPNGYGTVKSPHLLLHPGLVMLKSFVLVVEASAVNQCPFE